MGSETRRGIIYADTPGRAPEAVASERQSKDFDRPAMLSLTEAAEYLQISKAHLSNVINGKVRGVPPLCSFRLGRRVLLKREWIDRWIELAAHAGPAKC